MSDEQSSADQLPPYLQGKRAPAPTPAPEASAPMPPAGDEPAAATPSFQGAASGSQPTFRAPPRVTPQPQDDQSSRRVRSQPLPLSSPAPVPYDSPVAASPSAHRWRWTWVVVAIATIAWLVAIGMLSSGSGADRVSSPRLTLAAAWAFAAVVTFLPIELRRGLPGLTLQGVTGWTLLG